MCMLSPFSFLWLFVTLWAVAHQAPLSMGFSGEEYWSGCHFLLLKIFPTQGLNPSLQCLLHWQVNSLPVSHVGTQHEIINIHSFTCVLYQIF